ncbi:hypothetical protein LTR65_009885 [Meristemomyces frigidus]
MCTYISEHITDRSIYKGLVSLTIEFYRVSTSPCTHDSSGNLITPDSSDFPYGTAVCGLTCSIPNGPFSPIRRGSGNNIYVIPAPDKFSFGTATLVAAACCIPAILLLVSMWLKILQINYKKAFGEEEADNVTLTSCPDVHSRGGLKRSVKANLQAFFKLARNFYEVPVFGAAVLAVLVIGERNLFSQQVSYQTEPVTNIGNLHHLPVDGYQSLTEPCIP